MQEELLSVIDNRVPRGAGAKSAIAFAYEKIGYSSDKKPTIFNFPVNRDDLAIILVALLAGSSRRGESGKVSSSAAKHPGVSSRSRCIEMSATSRDGPI